MVKYESITIHIAGKVETEQAVHELRDHYDRVVVFPTRISGIYRIIASRGQIVSLNRTIQW